MPVSSMVRLVAPAGTSTVKHWSKPGTSELTGVPRAHLSGWRILTHRAEDNRRRGLLVVARLVKARFAFGVSAAARHE